ncbi:hypothetical protein CJF31_00001415 [Rutstroemia sp. NJR-2017a BVV2]|nr:hypothetical protein CJF31_00001415 [Rutstroemia sp. NJR-2017a BVV2]
MSGFLIAQVSTVAREAIAVCRALKLRYLWIDALCIVQDDKSDWERESAAMGSVYRHSYVTICAAASSSCHQGFLDRKSQTVNIRFQSSIVAQVAGTYSLRFSRFADFRHLRSMFRTPLDHDLLSCSWAARGWTYQETALSQRLLVLSSARMYIVCNYFTFSERIEGYQAWGTDPYLTSPFSSEEDLYGFSMYETYDSWLEVVHSYSCRKLTFATDRLPALSGLAQRVSEKTQDDYIAGIWRRDMLRGLFWNCKQRKGVGLQELLAALDLPDVYIAASWSFASAYGVVKFDLSGHDLDKYSFVNFREEWVHIDAQVVPEGLNPYGALKYGIMWITGLVADVPSDLSFVENRFTNIQRWEIKVNGRCVADCSIDWHSRQDTIPPGDLSMVLLGSCHARRASRPNQDELEESEDGEELEESEDEDSDSGFRDIPVVPKDLFDIDGNSLAPETQDKERHRYAFGLLLHPAKTEGKYYRVGTWQSTPRQGGLRSFCKDWETRSLEII